MAYVEKLAVKGIITDEDGDLVECPFCHKIPDLVDTYKKFKCYECACGRGFEHLPGDNDHLYCVRQ